MDEQELERFRKQTLSCWYLSGPTGSGKSRVGIALAQKLKAEIISLDSMAVYREMDIGTAKVMPEDRKGVPHHMIDIVDPSEEYSLSQYIQEARDKIDEIQLRGKKVLFVGGTPLYLKAMLRGIFEGPPADTELRNKLEKEAAKKGPEFLLSRLKKVDPVTAERLHANDTRRIIRALEVHAATGTPISVFQKQFDTGTPAEQCHVYVLQMPRDTLYAKINKRVDKMIYEGLLDEARELLERKLPIGKTARQALGYREMFDYIDKKLSYGDAVDLIKQNTRHFAKRQETWFRGLCECRFISAEAPEFEGVEESEDEDELMED